jgi:hypothetical protein
VSLGTGQCPWRTRIGVRERDRSKSRKEAEAGRLIESLADSTKGPGIFYSKLTRTPWNV